MPNVAQFTMPKDAATKAAEAAKGRDYYADLTAEERADEGLEVEEQTEEQTPPAEPEKPAEPAPAKPAKAPEAPGPPPAPEAPPAQVKLSPEVEALIESIADLREDLSDRIGVKDEASTEEADPLLEAALEHDDPLIRGLAERLAKSEQRLVAMEKFNRDQSVAAQEQRDDADFQALQQGFSVDGAQMTDAHVEEVENWMLEHPAQGKGLSIENCARVVFGDRLSRTPKPKEPATPTNGKATAGRVATIVDAASTGAPTPAKFKPRPNETIESALKAAGKSFGWTR